MMGILRRELETLLPADAFLPEGRPAQWPVDVPPPAAVLAPTSQDQLAAVLERSSREGWRVLPAGLCTWPGGCGTPEVDLVLSTRNLQEMSGYEPADLTFTADAGMPWSSLGQMTRGNGQWLPLDPPGAMKGSLGAVVATGVSGPLRQAYGAPRDHVLGVTLVSGDGRVLRWGGRVVKNVAGFDITRLSIGSWGALGVITSVSARLFPLPDSEKTLVLRAPTAEALLPAARAMALSPLPLSAVELLDPFGPGLGTRGEGEGSAGGAGLVLRMMSSEAQVREMENRLRRDLAGVETPVEGSFLLLRGEESASLFYDLGRWEEGAALVLRLSLLPSRMETLLSMARELEDRFGPVKLGVHVGWGVLRVAFPETPSKGEGRDGLASALESIRSRLEGAGGSLTLTEGPASFLKEVGVWGEAGNEKALLKGLKAEFDPAGILSPGRLGL